MLIDTNHYHALMQDWDQVTMNWRSRMQLARVIGKLFSVYQRVVVYYF